MSHSKIQLFTLPVGKIFLLQNATYELQPWAGSHISTVCEDAVAWSKSNNHNLSFNFNGCQVTVKPDSIASDVELQWKADLASQAEAYRRSPAGIAARERQERELAEHQALTDSIVGALPGVIANTEALIDSLVLLSDAVIVGVEYDPVGVAELLQTKWLDNDCVGISPAVLQADRHLMARWIIGQAINCLLNGMPPHPMIHKFAEYFKASPN